MKKCHLHTPANSVLSIQIRRSSGARRNFKRTTAYSGSGWESVLSHFSPLPSPILIVTFVKNSWVAGRAALLFRQFPLCSRCLEHWHDTSSPYHSTLLAVNCVAALPLGDEGTCAMCWMGWMGVWNEPARSWRLRRGILTKMKCLDICNWCFFSYGRLLHSPISFWHSSICDSLCVNGPTITSRTIGKRKIRHHWHRPPLGLRLCSLHFRQ